MRGDVQDLYWLDVKRGAVGGLLSVNRTAEQTLDEPRLIECLRQPAIPGMRQSQHTWDSSRRLALRQACGGQHDNLMTLDHIGRLVVQHVEW